MSAALAKLPPAVTFLDLSSNMLTGSLGAAACGLAAGGLEALYLGGNPITGSLPACLLSNGAPFPAKHAYAWQLVSPIARMLLLYIMPSL